ncbi:hypothetical protein HUJ04_007607 [Dendroctonus ponderosae]|nr:hypothetical protein HUJ04_007607 [Dendroctonus ponderosae]KAH1025697.1 hypothetical protein HUJ05_010373 [Dendroctonus ponderosae]
MWTLTDGECGKVGVLLKSKASVSIVVVGAYFEANVRLCRASLADGYGLSGSVVRNRSSSFGVGLPFVRSFREAKTDFSEELLLGFNRSLLLLKSVALLKLSFGVVGLDADFKTPLLTFELLPPGCLLEPPEVLEVFMLGI